MRTAAPITTGIAICMILLSLPAFCDVAPEPGFKRITLNLIVETNEDLSNYRFFIRSGADVKEVFVKDGEQVTIAPLGGGAYYSSGTLIAVPKKSLENLSDAQGEGKLNELQKAVYDRAVPGAIDLVNHSFSREVADREAAGFQDPIYRIERDPQAGLKAVYIAGGAVAGKTAPVESSGRLFWQSAAAAIVAGIFLLFGVTILGIMYFRKKANAL